MGSDPVASSVSPADPAKRVCPQCGTDLGHAGPARTDVQESRSPPDRPVEMDCPNCGQRLRQAVGGAWHLADEADLEETPGEGGYRSQQEAALDEALAESFPASDPPALS